jgi:hypothetical protein
MTASLESCDINYELTNDQVSLLADTVEFEPERSTIARAISVANVAESIGISLNLVDIDISVNSSTTSKFDSSFQAVKRYIPLAQSRGQKLSKVYDAMIDEAWNEMEEKKAGLDLKEWLAELTVDEIKDIEMVRTDYGDPFLSPVRLVVKSDSPYNKSYGLGDHFDFDTSANGDFGMLPEDIREQFEIKRNFWEGLGVRNATELTEFKDSYFRKVKVDLNGDAPPELAWLEAKDATQPEGDRIFPKLKQLHERTGQDVYLWTLAKTPPRVVGDVLRIASTQERYISTWLPALVKREKNPVILESDLRAISASYVEAISIASEVGGQDANSFKRKYLIAQLEKKLDSAHNFQQSIENITNLRSIVLGISIEGEARDIEAKLVLDSANDQLDQELSGDSVADRISIDTALYTMEGAKQILKAVPGLVGTAELLKHVPVSIIKDLATAVGASDDLLGLASEISSQRRQGNKWPEIRKQFSFVPAAAVGMIALGSQIENISYINPRLAAIAYTVSAFGTTGATLIAAFRSNTRKYIKLAEQGKLIDEPYVDLMGRELLYKSIDEASTPSHAATTARIRIETLLNRSHGISQKELNRRVDGIVDAALHGDPEAVVNFVKPTRREAFRAAYTETFRTNPVREGKLFSIPTMLILSSAIGARLISTPLIYIPFGMIESIGGLVRAKYADMYEGKLYRKQIQRATERLINDNN